MKNMLKRTLSMFVCVAMLISGIPAWGEEDNTIQVLEMIQGIEDSIAAPEEDPAAEVVEIDEIDAVLEEPTEVGEEPAEEPVEDLEEMEITMDALPEIFEEAPAADEAEPLVENQADSELPVILLEESEITMGVKEEVYFPNWTTSTGEMHYELETTYSVASAKIAKIDENGVITGVARGTTEVYLSIPGFETVAVKVTVKAAPSRITLVNVPEALGVGEPLYPEYKLNSTNAASHSIEWFSSNERVVGRIYKGFVAVQVSDEPAEITAKTFNGKVSKPAKVWVKNAPDGIALDAEALELEIGASHTLTATLLCEAGEAASAITYKSSNENVVSVDANGKITVVGYVSGDESANTVTITAETYNGKSAQCVVTAIPVPVTITMNAERTIVGVGETVNLNTAVEPAEAATKLTYKSSSAKVASVDENGVVTALRAGNATITVTAHNGVKATIKIQIKAAPTKIELSTERSVLGVGETTQLSYKLTSAKSVCTVEYSSSDASIATVDANGVVTAKGVGEAKITVETHNGKTAEVVITVKHAPTGVKLAESQKEISKGDSYKIEAQPIHIDATGAEYEAAGVLSYTSSNEAVAVVDATGLVKVVGYDAENEAANIVKITVKSYQGEAAEFTVIAVPVPEKVNVSAARTIIGVGETVNLNTEVLPEKSATTLKYKSSSAKVASVDDNGVVTALRAGNVTITVTAHNGVKATIKIQIKAAPTKIELSTERSVLGVGETTQLSYKLTSAKSVCTVEYSSSDASIATVDANGVVTAKGVGEAKITIATHNGKTAEVAITVKHAPTGVKLAESQKEISKGDSYKIEAQPIHIDATGAEYEAAGVLSYTSSNEAVAVVDATGLVKVVGYDAENEAANIVKITVKPHQGEAAEFTVIAVPVPEKVNVSAARTIIGVGETINLNTEVLPEKSATTLKYKSSSAKVANVDDNGVVTALRAGNATITVTAHNGVKATIKIQIKAAPTKIELSTERSVLGVGETTQLSYKLTSAKSVCTVTYSSDNENVATVDANGVVTAKGVGEAKITVETHNGKTAEVAITVKHAPTGVKLAESQKEISKGDSYRIEAQPIHIDATGAEYEAAGVLSYTSSNEAVAVVDATGLVKVVGYDAENEAANIVKITVKPHQGEAAEFTVIAVPVPEKVNVSAARTIIGVGETINLNTEVLPEKSATTLKYKSSSAKVASVDDNGVVTALRAGNVTITVTAHNGVKATIKIQIKAAPTKIELSTERSVLGVGETTQLSYKLTSAKSVCTVAYTSSDENIATVDANGVVTAVGAGEATLTVTTHNGRTDSVVITVIEALVIAEFADDVSAEKAAYVGDSITWSAEIEGGMKPYKSTIEVFKGEQSVYTSSEAFTFTPSADGEYHAVLKVEDAYGNTAQAKSAALVVKALPGKVQNLAAEQLALGADALYLTWKADANAQYYKVYIDGAEAAQVKGTWYEATNLTIGKEYSFTVAACVEALRGEYEAAASDAVVLAAVEELEITSFAADKETVYAGAATNVKYSLTAEGGKAPYSYNYKVYLDGALYTEASSASGEYTLNVLKGGEYYIVATVTDAYGNTAEATSGKLTAHTAPESVSLTAESTKLYAGETLQLSYAFTPAEAYDTVTYASGDEAIAIVDANGKVTGLSEGTVTITVKTSLGLTGSITLTVEAIPAKFTTEANEDGTLTITGLAEEFSGVMFIPAEIDGVKVSAIGDSAFFNVSTITGVVIGDGIETIEDAAFRVCPNIESVVIPGSVKSIGMFAFYGLTNLTSLTLGEGIETLGYMPFGYCENLTSVVLPNSVTSIGTFAFAECYKLENVTLSNSLEVLTEGAFMGCTSLKTIEIPASVRDIEMECFALTGIESIVIPDTVVNLYDAFQNHEALTSIVIGAQNVGDFAFARCTNLSEVVLTENVREIGSHAFYNCPSLKEMTIPATVESFKDNVFAETDVTLIVEFDSVAYHFARDWGYNYIPVGEVENGPLYYEFNEDGETIFITGCEGEVKGALYIPEEIDGHTVTGIGAHAFEDQQHITSVVIPATVEFIDSRAFHMCRYLTSVEFAGAYAARSASALTSIGERAFAECDRLESLVVPEGVVFIGSEAFAYNDCMLSLTIPASVTEIEGGIVDGTEYVVITVPEGDSAIRDYAAENGIAYTDGVETSLHVFKVREVDSRYDVGVGETVTWTADVIGGTGNYQYKYSLLRFGEEIHNTGWVSESEFSYTPTETGYYMLVFSVTDGVNSIDDVYCENGVLASTYSNEQPYSYVVYDEENKLGILSGADFDALSGDITIPQVIDGYTINEISRYVFRDDDDITSITIPEGYTYIGTEVFSEMDGLNTVYLPSTLKYIEYAAFANCHGLQTITIPGSVDRIHDDAFVNCGSLREVILEEGIKEIGQRAFANSGIREITIPGSAAFDYYAFGECYDLEVVRINDGSTSLGSCMFENCGSLREVYLPASLGELSDGVFQNCHHLESINLSGVKYIGNNAFNECHSLGYADLSSAEFIDEVAFANCHSLSGVEFGEGLTTIGQSAFNNCHSLSNIEFPSSLESVGSWAFTNCHNLGEIDLRGRNIGFGENVFGGSNVCLIVDSGSDAYHYAREWGIDYVTFGEIETDQYHIEINEDGETVTITGYGFEDYIELEGTLNIPETIEYEGVTYTVTAIGEHVFNDQQGITALFIPGTVKTIGQWAFANLRNLRALTISEGVENIDWDAFNGCESLTGVDIPSTVTRIAGGAFAFCHSLRDIYFWQDASTEVDFTDDCVLDGSQNVVVSCYADSAAEAFAQRRGIPYKYHDGSFESLAIMSVPATRWAGFEGEYAEWEVIYNGIDVEFLYELLFNGEVIHESEWTTDTTFGWTCENTGRYRLAVAARFAGDENEENYVYRESDDWMTVSVNAGDESGWRYAFFGEGAVSEQCIGITGYEGELEDGVLTIPDTIDGYTVEGIMDDAFNDRDDIRQVIFNEHLYGIQDRAFFDCDSLENVVFTGPYLNYIDYSAFDNCDNLRQIDLPDSLAAIESNAFSCTPLQAIRLPANLEYIGVGAFEDCRELAEVDMSAVTKLEIIGERAFNRCENLQEIAIPDCVKEISNDAFCECYALRKVTLGSGLERIQSCAFFSCCSLEEINLGDCTNLTSINGSAFEHCCSLREIVIPDSVTEMAHRVFLDCHSLESAVMSNGLIGTSMATFENCHSLRSVDLPDNLEFIESWAFKNCHSLSDIQIPDSVGEIHECAFESCGSLGTLALSGNIYHIDASAFDGANVSLMVEIGTRAHELAVEYGWDYIPIGEADANRISYYHENDYIVVNGYDGPVEGELTIPEYIDDTPVRVIDWSAFQGQERLTKVVIPGTVETILVHAFANCRNLTTIEFQGNNLVEIQEHAFNNCYSLTSVYVPDGVNYIGHNAFGWCEQLQELHIPASVEKFDDQLIEGSRRCVLYVEEGSAAEAYAIENELPYDNGSHHPFDVLEVYYTKHTDVVGDHASWEGYIVGADQIIADKPYNFQLYKDGKLHEDFGWSADPFISYTFEEGGYYEMALRMRKDDAESVVTEFCFSDTLIIGWEEEGGMFRYNYCGEDEVRITSFTGMEGNTLVIPETINDATVVGIAANAFNGRGEIEWVELPATIRFIDDWAFAYCHNLMGINLNAAPIEYIGSNAFESCHRLDNVVLPETLREIGSEAFWNCSSMQSIVIPGNVFSIGERCFAECHGLQNVTIETAKLDEIKGGTFQNCHSLNGITIPEGVSAIRWEAFNNTGIEYANLPSTLETIEDNAFSDSHNLRAIEIPDAVTYIGYDAFRCCCGMESATLGTGLVTLQACAFMDCHSMQSINLGDCANLNFIGGSAFERCHSLKSVELPASVELFENRLFYDCHSLETAIINAAAHVEIEVETPDGDTFIDHVYTTRWATFENCYSLHTVQLPANLTSVANWAFLNCHSLRNINIPETVVGFGESAFQGCGSLGEIYLNKNIYNIEDCVFDDSSAILLVEPDCYAYDRVLETDWNYRIIGVEADEGGIQYWIAENDEGKPVEAIVNGYEGDLVGDLVIPASIEVDGVEIPVTVINDWVFAGQDRLMSVTIPASVMCINTGAFADCHRMASVTIEGGSKLEEIWDEAFENCHNLTSINLEAAEDLKVISNRAFAECYSLNGLTFPAGIEEIGDEITAGCPLIVYFVEAGSVAEAYAIENGIAYSVDGGESFAFCLQYVGIESNASVPGEEATWRAYTIGGSNVQYKYRLYRAGEYVLETDWVEEDTFTYTFDQNGAYMVGVTARSDNGDGTYTYYPLDENGEADQKYADGEVFISECHEETRFGYSILEHNEEEGLFRVAIVGCEEDLGGDITIPATLNIDGIDYHVIEIMESAFAGNPHITGITVEEGVYYIGSHAFRDMENLRYLNLPSTLEEIRNELACWNRNLEEVTIASATMIEDGAFQGCENLHTVTLPDNLFRISHWAFAECYNLQNINLPASLEEIGDHAFAYCHSMQLDELPENVWLVEGYAFEECRSIGDIRISAALEGIGENIFCNAGVYVIADANAPILEYCLEWGYDFEAHGQADDGRLFWGHQDGGAWITGYDGSIIGELVIPGTVYDEETGDQLDVTGIAEGALAFQNGMTGVVIPASVKTIATSAFTDCNRLLYVSIEDTSELTEIQPYAFAYCEQLGNVELHNAEALEVIGEYAFDGCNVLDEVTISATVTEMGANIFRNCHRVHLKVAAGSTAETYAIANGIPYDNGSGYALTLLEVSVDQWANYVGDEATWRVHAIGGSGAYQYQYQLYRNGEAYGEASGWIDSETYTVTLEESGAYMMRAQVKDAAGNTTAIVPTNDAVMVRTYDEETTIHYAIVGDNEAIITGMDDIPNDLVIPDTVAGYAVVEIGSNAFEGRGEINSLTLPETVRYIGPWAFAFCENLHTVNLPASLKGIDEFGFGWCGQLRSIELPDGLIYMGNCALIDCETLEEVVVPDSVINFGDEVMADCDNLRSVKLPAGMEVITRHFFRDCANLESVIIPETVEEIGLEAFIRCESLTEITIPASVKTIDDGAFSECYSLATLNLNEGLEYIGAAAFYKNESLKELIMPDTITRVRGQAFDSCHALETVRFSENLEHLTNWSFASCYALTEITVPASVGSIGSYTFCDCVNLEKVTLPANGNLTIIEQSAFFKNEKLKEITIPDTVTEIGPIAFDSCYALESVTLSANLTELQNYTFANCHSLKAVEVPAGVKHIGTAVFAENYDLVSVILPEGLESIGVDCFIKDGSLTTLVVPQSVTEIGENAFAETNEAFKLYVVEGSAAHDYAEENGIAYELIAGGQMYESYIYTANSAGTGAVINAYLGADASVVVPETINGLAVVEIGDGAFEGNTAMTEIDLPDTIEVIGARAFANCTSLAVMC